MSGENSMRGSEPSDSPFMEPVQLQEITSEMLTDEENIFRLRLAETQIYLGHLQSIRKSWYIFATLSWLLTIGALFLALLPYLHVALAFTVPNVISYVCAFVVVITLTFALVSSLQAVTATNRVAQTKLHIDRALAVARTFGVSLKLESTNG